VIPASQRAPQRNSLFKSLSSPRANVRPGKKQLFKSLSSPQANVRPGKTASSSQCDPSKPTCAPKKQPLQVSVIPASQRAPQKKNLFKSVSSPQANVRLKKTTLQLSVIPASQRAPQKKTSSSQCDPRKPTYPPERKRPLKYRSRGRTHLH
jgi:hypothetical protein